MAKAYALMMLISNETIFEGCSYTWRPWSADLERWLRAPHNARHAEALELTLFAMPEGYSVGKSDDGSVTIYGANGYEADIVTTKKRNILYAREYSPSDPPYLTRRYFNEIVRIWEREDEKKVYHEDLAKIAGMLDDKTINQIYGAIAYDLGEDEADEMLGERIEIAPADGEED